MINKRVMVIGLDGATWDLIDSWTDKGELPNFKRLMENGCYGSLASTIPHVTPPAWTSMTTGKNPAKHGIFDFTSIKRNNRGWDLNLYNSKSKKSKEIWDYLKEKSIVVNIPLTYPPHKINGLMVTGMYTPDIKSGFTYPQEMKNEILKSFPNYKIELDWNKYEGRKQKFLKDLYKMTEERIKLFWYFFSMNWKFFFFVFVGTDRLQHIYWNEDELLNYYRYLDTFLEKVIKKIKKKNINLLIVSDHGFAKIKKIVHPNSALLKEGYLKLTSGQKSSFLDKFGVNKGKLWKILLKYNLIRLYRKVPTSILHLIRKSVPGKSNPIYDFDLKKSKAIMVGSGTIYILEENKSLKKEIENEIINKLEKLKDPDTHNDIIDKVFRKTEIYIGNSVDNVPDLVILPKKGYSLAFNVTENIIENPHLKIADHAINGIFLAYGPDITNGSYVEGAKIYDIAPTILHMFGLPIPSDLDGRVLKRIFKKDSEFAKRKTEYVVPDFYDRKQEAVIIKNVIKNLKLKGKV